MNVIFFIGQTSPDIGAISRVAYEALGRNVTDAAVNSKTKMPPILQMGVALANLANAESATASEILSHLHLSAIFITHHADLNRVVTHAAMPVMVVDTLARDYVLGVMTGTLNQWRDACNSGLKDEVTADFFEKVRSQLLGMNIDLWRPNNQKRLN